VGGKEVTHWEDKRQFFFFRMQTPETYVNIMFNDPQAAVSFWAGRAVTAALA
jgi:hypothetical protein